MARVELIRISVIGLLAFSFLSGAALFLGVRYNGTRSFPEGFYLSEFRPARYGDLVFVKVSKTPIFEMAADRGYLNVGWSPVNHLLKRVLGCPGDIVTIDLEGVEVNGTRIKNSAPLKRDLGGRPLKPWLTKDEIIAPDEVLLISDYNPASFDSRYFGPVKSKDIESVMLPLWTWE